MKLAFEVVLLATVLGAFDIAVGESEEICLSVRRPQTQQSNNKSINTDNQIQNLTEPSESFRSFLDCRNRPAERGWFVAGNNGNCFQYLKSNTTQDWESSSTLCQTLGGNLANIGIRHSNVRSAILRNVLGNDAVWLGLNDIMVEESFVWSNGDRFVAGDVEWLPNQPDNVDNQDCVQLNVDFTRVSFGNKIDDEHCFRNTVHALCEKPLY